MDWYLWLSDHWGYLKNQALLSTLFGLQISPNLGRSSSDFHIRTQFTPRQQVLAELVSILTPSLPKPPQPSLSASKGHNVHAGSHLFSSQPGITALLKAALLFSIWTSVCIMKQVRKPWLAERKEFGCNWPQLTWYAFIRRNGSDPWVGKITWRRAWQTIPVFLPGESHGQRSLAGYSPWGWKESDTAEETNTFTL